jgi:hypothetical protein
MRHPSRELIVKTRYLVSFACLAGALAACGSSAEEDDSSSGDESAFTSGTSYDPYANLDADLGEAMWPNEKRDISATAEIITTFLKRRYDEGRQDPRGRVRYLRDAHAKGHGCVHGDFKVREDLPEDLRVGVFAAAQDYKVWVRYSNGNSEVRYDWKRDARGMAIKLTSVPGAKVVTDLPEQSTQDFVMINHPVFFVDNPVKYADTLKVFHSGLGFETLGQIISVAKLPLENAKLALAVNGSEIKNPVAEPYWSMAPIRLGRGHAVKYASIPVACGEERTFPTARADQVAWIQDKQDRNKTFLPSTDRDSLRSAMQKTLEKDRSDVCYLFVLQRFIDQEKTPIEHSTVDWDDASPFVPVADLKIPAQTFTSEAQDTFCEDMAFTPWHALPEHKPLGVVNRTRLVVYSATAKLRREGNRVENPVALHGPTGDERF